MHKKVLVGTAAVLVVITGIIVAWQVLRPPAPTSKDPFLRSIQLMEKPEGRPFSAQEFEELVRFSSDPNELVRTHALVALARCQSEPQRSRALAIMRQSLHDPSETVSIFALRGLALLGDASDIQRVKPFLEHPNPLVRSRASKTLAALREKNAHP